MAGARAVAHLHCGPLDGAGGLVDVEIEVPAPTGHDLLVEVRAVSVNPVDVKLRSSVDPGGRPRVLGFDAAGVVLEAGPQASGFRAGDEVFYAGSVARPGSYATLQLVDERIVGRKPRSLDFAAAAAVPLTAITAWEALFDRLRLTADSAGALLVVAGAGGVGSMAIQLARRLTNLTVVATASRPESVAWARQMGAHQVANPLTLLDEVAASSVDAVVTPFSATNVEVFATVLRPYGAVVAVDEPDGLDLLPLKGKSQSWHWEDVFTRSLYEPDSRRHQELLDEVSRLIDAGTLHSTMTAKLGPLNAATLTAAHRQVESMRAIGKVVVEI